MTTETIAVISGGLGDIGSAVAVKLATTFGVAIALGDIRPEADAEPLLEELRALKCNARYTQVNVSDAQAVNQWIGQTEKHFGTAPDWIIPNAAIVTLKGICDLQPADWAQELAVNLSGGFYLAQSGAKRLLESGKPGRIIFLGSWAAEAVHTTIPAYCVTKAGLRMLMRCMALDLAPKGILVAEVAPGIVDAGLSGRFFAKNPDQQERTLRLVPNSQFITAEEVAFQVAHLCHPENRHMNGATLLMDGGLSLVTPGSRTVD